MIQEFNFAIGWRSRSAGARSARAAVAAALFDGGGRGGGNGFVLGVNGHTHDEDDKTERSHNYSDVTECFSIHDFQADDAEFGRRS